MRKVMLIISIIVIIFGAYLSDRYKNNSKEVFHKEQVIELKNDGNFIVLDIDLDEGHTMIVTKVASHDDFGFIKESDDEYVLQNVFDFSDFTIAYIDEDVEVGDVYVVEFDENYEVINQYKNKFNIANKVYGQKIIN